MDAITLSTLTGIWPSVCGKLVNNYNVLDGYSLVSYDDNMFSLYEKLQKYKNYTFGPTDVLVFTLYDTDFYYLDSTIGFTTYNLITILIELEIDLRFCILFTNHHGISENIYKYFNNSNLIIFENNFSTQQTLHDSTTLPDHTLLIKNDLKYHFCFLSHVVREHRSLLRCFIEHEKIRDKTLLSWHPILYYNNHNNTEFANFNDHHYNRVPTLITTQPFTRFDNQLKSEEFNFLHNEYGHILNEKVTNKMIPSLMDGGHPEKESYNLFYAYFLKYCFINIVTESTFNDPYPYLSEKTFKCFWHKSPFLLVASKDSLKYLKSIGFKTFDSWIDESYDSEINPTVRLQKIFSIIKEISSWSLNQCKIMYNEMLPVLEHNYNHYKNFYLKEYVENQIQ